MSSTSPQGASPAEQAMVAAMVERMRQLRRRSGVPNGVSLNDAVALHFISEDDVERARWGDAGPGVTPTGERSR